MFPTIKKNNTIKFDDNFQTATVEQLRVSKEFINVLSTLPITNVMTHFITLTACLPVGPKFEIMLLMDYDNKYWIVSNNVELIKKSTSIPLLNVNKINQNISYQVCVISKDHTLLLYYHKSIYEIKLNFRPYRLYSNPDFIIFTGSIPFIIYYSLLAIINNWYLLPVVMLVEDGSPFCIFYCLELDFMVIKTTIKNKELLKPILRMILTDYLQNEIIVLTDDTEWTELTSHLIEFTIIEVSNFSIRFNIGNTIIPLPTSSKVFTSQFILHCQTMQTNLYKTMLRLKCENE